MDTLDIEILCIIGINLPLLDLENYLSTNLRLASLSSNESFWHDKLGFDFGLDELTEASWKDTYRYWMIKMRLHEYLECGYEVDILKTNLSEIYPEYLRIRYKRFKDKEIALLKKVRYLLLHSGSLPPQNNNQLD